MRLLRLVLPVNVLNYAPRILQPDMMSLWPPTEVAEGYFTSNAWTSISTPSRPSTAARFPGAPS